MPFHHLRPGFAAELSRYGGRLAVVAPDGAEITYRELADRVAETTERLGTERRLVLVAAANEVEPLVAYLAALAAGHPVLLAPARDDRTLAALVDAYDPDVVVRAADGDWRFDERRPMSAHVLHPELALLLSTSGSTGSPKLVRLSAAGLAANAAAIAEYLDIRDTDRAGAALPMHYCYGLSVINSNLLCGAAVLLSDRSVTDPAFWSAFRRHGGTSLHGVPYTFELLDRVGFPAMQLPHLRYVTQAGGRLAPDTVRRYAELGARQGWQLFVMYGPPRADRRRPGHLRTVREAFRSVFPIQDLPGDATFVGLGGDSLSYVQMTTALQQVLDRVPTGWETMSIDTLARLPPARTRAWVRTETAVVLRTVAILLVVGSHIGLFRLLGGSHVLLAVAGWAFARFVLPAAAPDTAAPDARHRVILRCAARIAVPSILWITWRAGVEDDVDLVNVLLMNQFLDPAAWGHWYVETLIQTLLLLALLFAVPAVVRLERAHPFPFALGLTVVALLGRLHPDTGNEFSDRLMSTHLVLWIFALGWLVQRATTAGQRTVAALLVLLLVPTFFEEPLRGAVVTAGLLLLLLPDLPVPRWSLRPIGTIAASSLAIYLTHYAIYPHLLAHLPALVVTAACVPAGIAVWWVSTGLATAVVRHHAALVRAGHGRRGKTVSRRSLGRPGLAAPVAGLPMLPARRSAPAVRAGGRPG